VGVASSSGPGMLSSLGLSANTGSPPPAGNPAGVTGPIPPIPQQGQALPPLQSQSAQFFQNYPHMLEGVKQYLASMPEWQRPPSSDPKDPTKIPYPMLQQILKYMGHQGHA